MPDDRPRASVMTEVLCTCERPGSIADANPECRRHGTEANRHPHWRAAQSLAEMIDAAPVFTHTEGAPEPVEPEPNVRVERERDRLLAQAGTLISGDREDQYGSARDGFARTGAMWAAMLGLDTITAEQVAMMLAALKISRLCNDSGHRDSWLDLIGYAALGGDIADETAKELNAFRQR